MGDGGPQRSAGFGVGVLEEEDGEDEDLYEQDDMRRYDRYLGQTAPALDRFAHHEPRHRDALTLHPHQDPVLPGFAKAANPSTAASVSCVLMPALVTCDRPPSCCRRCPRTSIRATNSARPARPSRSTSLVCR